MRERDILQAVLDISDSGDAPTSMAIYDYIDGLRKFRLGGRLAMLDALFLTPNIGKLHVLLFRAERRGLLGSDWVPGPSPRKRVYRLTDFGMITLSRHD